MDDKKCVASVTQTVITRVLRRSACQVWYIGGEAEVPTMTGRCVRSQLRCSTRTPGSLRISITRAVVLGGLRRTTVAPARWVASASTSSR
jgi:hypothetical protein